MTYALGPVAPARLWQHTLTPRTAAVIELVSYGLTGREIAERLFIAENTVKFHKTRAMRLTGASNSVQLARWWWEHIERAAES